MSYEDQIQKIKAITDEIGGQYENSYSGRGMYGMTCVGIHCKDAIQGIHGGRFDTMSKESVAYWPSIKEKQSGGTTGVESSSIMAIQ